MAHFDHIPTDAAEAVVSELFKRHLNQDQLARRWSLSARTLERWRSTGKGPSYLRLGGRIAYRLEDIEAFEAAGWHRHPIPSKTDGAVRQAATRERR